MSDLQQGVEFSHYVLKRHLEKGDKVVDATVGNGYDTKFLAELVGEKGQVWGFDLQQEAIERAKERLSKAGLSHYVRLIQSGHQDMEHYIEPKVAGILFNLGYLPGGDKSIVTHPETTLRAVESGLNLLKVGGVMVLVVYTGHAIGKKEATSLLKNLKELDHRQYNVLQYQFINQPQAPPQVIAVKKRS